MPERWYVVLRGKNQITNGAYFAFRQAGSITSGLNGRKGNNDVFKGGEDGLRNDDLVAKTAIDTLGQSGGGTGRGDRWNMCFRMPGSYNHYL